MTVTVTLFFLSTLIALSRQETTTSTTSTPYRGHFLQHTLFTFAQPTDATNNIIFPHHNTNTHNFTNDDDDSLFIYAQFASQPVTLPIGYSTDQNFSFPASGPMSDSLLIKKFVQNRGESGDSGDSGEKLYVDWATSISGASPEVLITGDVHVQKGLVYAVGYTFSNPTLFDREPFLRAVPPREAVPALATGGVDLMVALYDMEGVYQWAKAFGSNGGIDYAFGSKVDSNGDLIIVGSLGSSGQFGPTITTDHYGTDDVFIGKMASSGVILWAITCGGPNRDVGASVQINPVNKDEIYVFGVAQGPWFKCGPTINETEHVSVDRQSVFVAKINGADGTVQHVKFFGAENVSLGASEMAMDSCNQYLYLTGGFIGELQVPVASGVTSTISSPTVDNVYVMKYDPEAQQVMWLSEITAGGAMGSKSIKVNSKNETIVGGHFSLGMTFGNSELVASGKDGFVAKFDADGGALWVRKIGGAGGDVVSAIAIGSDDRVFVAGQMSTNAAFDDAFSLTASGSQFVIEMNTQPNCSALNDCSGSGTCIGDNVCQCAEHFVGDDCSFNCANVGLQIRGGQVFQIRRRDSLSLIPVVNRCTPKSPLVEYVWERLNIDINPTFFSGPVSSFRLNFDPYEFPLGPGTYTFKFSVMTLPVNMSTVVTIEVLDDGPVARIKYGNRKVALNTRVELDASASYYSGAEDLPAQYSWSCVAISPSGPCPYEPLSSGSRISVILTDPGVYSFQLNYTIAGQSATHSVTIESVANLDLPLPVIVTDYYPYISTSWRVQFKAILDRSVGSNYGILWSIYKQDATLGTVEQPLNLNQIAVPSLDLKELVILPNVFSSNSSYLVRCSVFNTENPLDSTFSEINIWTSPKPTGGTIDILPVPGSINLFNLTASGWSAHECTQPLRYSFEFLSSTGEWLKLSPYLSMESTTVTLPFSNNEPHNTSVRVRVRNRFEEESEAITSVIVEPSLFTDGSEIVQWVEAMINQTMKDLLNGSLFDGELESRINVLTEIVITAKPLINELLCSVLTEFIKTLKQAQDIKIEASDPLPFEYRVHELQVLSYVIPFNVEHMGTDMVRIIIQMLARIFADNIDVTWKIDDGVLSVLMTDDIVRQAIQISSSIAPQLTGVDKSISDDFLTVLINVAKRAITSKVPGETETNVSTMNVDMIASLQYVSKVTNSSMSVNQDQVVVLPSHSLLDTFGDGSPDSEAGLIYILMRVDTYSWMNHTTPSTPIIVFKLLDGHNVSVLDVKDLADPITFILDPQFNISSMEQSDEAKISFTCKYFNEFDDEEAVWSTDGCYFDGYTHDNRVVCKCNHTTSFAAFIEYSRLPDGKDIGQTAKGIFVASVSVNIVLTGMALPLIVILFVVRNSQPAKSRFLGPFIGLLAVLAECILQGIVRNSLLVADYEGNRERANVLHHVIMLIVNPLSITAWFIFLWQQFRYYLLKHIYEAMSRKQKPTITLARTLSSPRVYIVACCTVMLATFAYFLLFLILRVTNVLTYETSIAIQSVSYFSMSLALMLGVVALFLWDMIFERVVAHAMTQWKKSANLHESLSRGERASKAKQYFLQYFWSNDPLRFRIETVLMLVTIAFAMISYIIGITMQVRQMFTDELTITQFVFDVLYLFMRIIVFGVFVGCCSVVNFVRSYLRPRVKMLNDDNDLASMIRNFIKDERTYPLIHEYCLNEFSLENLYLWRELDQLRPTLIGLQPAQRRMELKSIKERFLSHNCELEVNVPHEVRRRFIRICESETARSEEIDDCVAALFNSVMNNVSDTWIRFENCPEYRLYMRSKELDQQLQASPL